MLKKTILYLLILIICFYLAPFISLLCGSHYRNACFRELYYQLLTDKITKQQEASATVLLYQFIKDNLGIPKESGSKRTSPYEVIVDGEGYCDEQANALITLAGECGIEGKLVFLYGSDSISHHAVSELKINDHFVMFDPFYHQLFFTKEHTLASVNDIQNGNVDLSKHFPIPTNYFNLFEKKYPYEVFRTNEISFPKKIVRNYLTVWYSLFGNIAKKPYFGSYFLINGTTEKEKVSIENLLN